MLVIDTEGDWVLVLGLFLWILETNQFLPIRTCGEILLFSNFP